MKKKNNKMEAKPIKIKFLIFLALSGALIWPLFLKAADNNAELKRQLEAQINQKQQEINQYQVKIQENQSKAKTLKNEIQILEDQISQIRLQVNQIDMTIQGNALSIQDIGVKVSVLEGDISRQKEVLAEYLRTVASYDQETLLEVVLKNESFSDFFDELNALENTQTKLQETLKNIYQLKSNLEGQKSDLEQAQEEQYLLRNLQLIQKKSVETKQDQKDNLLKQTKGEENRFQQMVKNVEQAITQIREQLSLLERYNISLSEAVQEAIFAASHTGIRPAFLLGVLEAESRLGLNVGTGNWQKDMYQCYLKLGYKTTAENMKNAFLSICQELGLDPNLQSVSAEPWYGCGGAMGVAQFMPTTWLAYRDRVTAITGHNPPSPWKHRDAFVASAIKLSDGGANQRTEIGERTAYAKYLGGANYKKWINSKVTDYVIKLANNFQEQYFK